MHRPRVRHRFTAVLGGLIVLSLMAIPVSANNWWEPYHWGRTSNPFTLAVGANVGPDWTGPLAAATDNFGIDNGTYDDMKDWSDSSILDMRVVTGTITAKNRKKCPPTAGRVEVCSASLGGGYLGVAQIWSSGEHITQATVKVNDSYYSKPPYNNFQERQSVLCEELGHTIGVDHAINESGGCVIGYPASPPPLVPSTHDYEMIEGHYEHLDSKTTVGATTAVAAREETEMDPRGWGAVLEEDEHGRPSVYGKDLAPGQRVTTFVVYPDNAENATVNDGTGGGVDDGTVGDGGKRDGGKKDSKRDGGKQRHDKRHR